jgi:Zc3h12a-like Ribonuclease NYN domain
MSPSHVVVDGSNIATEGRSTPSLQQLDDAIRQFQAEFPDTEVIVVVDATFGHRIDSAERAVFDEAVAHGELVSPPAGAIGRGDAFVLRVAERVGAQVLSNDSFQEFHAEHPWLFEEGRLMGGKPIPGIGWIFTPRLPVRGPRSRAATSTGSGRSGRSRTEEDPPSKPARSRRTSKVAAEAIALATEEATSPRAAKASKEPAKAAKTAKAATRAPAAKTTKSVKAAKATKATKATTSDKATKAAKAAKAPAKAATKAAAKTSAKAVKEPGKAAATIKKTGKTSVASSGPAEVAGGETRKSSSRRGRRGRGTAAPVVQAAIEAATEEALGAPGPASSSPPATPRTRRPTSGEPVAPAAVNDPLTFLTFVTEHPLGSSVLGTVSSFVSHGAMVDVDGMSCYLPLTGLGDPPPRRAREVVDRGEERSFVVVALDPPRRGAELALPEMAAAKGQGEAEPARGGSRRPRRAGQAAS